MSGSQHVYAAVLTLICIGYGGCAIYLGAATRIAWKLGGDFFGANVLLVCGLCLHLARKLAFWEWDPLPHDIPTWIHAAVLLIATEFVFLAGGIRLYHAMRRLWSKKLGRLP